MVKHTFNIENWHLCQTTKEDEDGKIVGMTLEDLQFYLKINMGMTTNFLVSDNVIYRKM